MGWCLTVEDGPGTELRFALPDCTMDFGSMVLESTAAADTNLEQRKQFLRRELQPVLPPQTEE